MICKHCFLSGGYNMFINIIMVDGMRSPFDDSR